jgi:hypothetical protein
MAADYRLFSMYPASAICKRRNWCALSSWAGFITSNPIPNPPPDEQWVKERITGERIPLLTNHYIDSTLSYYMQDGQTQAAVRDLLSEYNDTATEESLAAMIEDVTALFMPRFCASTVTKDQVDAWMLDHSFTPFPVVMR